MDLTYIENYLTNLLENSDEYIKNRMQELIIMIQKHKKKEDDLESITTVFSTLNHYDSAFLVLVEEYRVLSGYKGIQYNSEKNYKVQEILATLSCLDSYVMNILHRGLINNVAKDQGTLYKHVDNLKQKREHYKNEKFTWTTTLRALTIENSCYVEMKKLQKENDI